VRTLLDLPLPSSLGGPVSTLPRRLVDAWLAHPAVRPFIRLNAYDGVEWFHRESYDELLAWVERLERIEAPRSERARTPVAVAALVRRLREAAEASGYRVDRLREQLSGPVPSRDGAVPTPAPAATPRLPKATGLPPGPTTPAEPSDRDRR
jgi:hypothetical protein